MVESSLIGLLIVLAAAIVLAIVAARRKAGAQAKPGRHLSRGSASASSSDRPERDVVPPVGSAGSTADVSRATRIFLSYRREDSADVAGRIYDRLTQSFDASQVFKDVDSIPLGVDFRKHLQETVGRCDVLLAVVGDRWLTAANDAGHRRIDDAKDFVRIELEAALQRDIPIIPVLVRGTAVPQEHELPPALAALAYRNGIAVRPDPDFHRDMDRLIRSLQTYAAGTPAAG